MISSIEKRIRNTILEMEKPFRISDLLIRLDKQGISNTDLILEVIDELQDAGLIGYAEIIDNCWAYRIAI